MPESLAERILSDLDPAASQLPIDISNIINSYGVKIEWAGLFKNKHGVYLSGKPPIIICSRAISPQRARFTLAHELYHHLDYLISPSHNKIRFYMPDFVTERKANLFASALLMPRQAVINLHRLGKSSGEMAVIFGVSAAALSVRMDELGIAQNISNKVNVLEGKE